MCGIAGFLHPDLSAETRRGAVERMCDAMRHRGPDDDGWIVSGPAALGMRRLAIFDPKHGHQPMITSDGRFHVVFNGAIYNFKSLRAELSELGHSFKTDCDTEVVLAGYAQWGDRCVNRFRGMFALACWDAREQTLFLARDPFGIKPLYFAQIGDGVLFASEIAALLKSGHCSNEPDDKAVGSSLAYLAVPAPRTLYRHIRSLRPGECGVWHGRRFNIRTYWTFRDASRAQTQPCVSREEFLAELRERLVDSIRAHSLADVPVGAFLSGGLDSSSIVGLMSRHSRSAIKTFSIGFSEPGYSEAQEAAKAAAHFGTQHQLFVLTGERVAKDIDRILDTLDQPTGDALNTYYVSQVAKEGGVTVALSGLGGDELFGGYAWFKTTPRLARVLPVWSSLPEKLRSRVVQHLQGSDARKQKLGDLLAHGRNLHELAGLQRRNFAEPARQALLTTHSPFEAHAELQHLPDELDGADPFSTISAWEMRTYMSDVLLRDSDVMSMKHSLELRVPFIDRPLIEWFWRQPQRFKVAGGKNKAALADALADILPPGTGERAKQGFTLPLAIWMRGPLRGFLDDTFSPASIEQSGFFKTEAVQSRWRQFIDGNDPREWSRVWSLAVLIAFLNRRKLVRK
jgi:asparagine synthase (glutamine-hydrolysing)